MYVPPATENRTAQFGESNLTKEVAAFKGRRDRVKQHMNETYASKLKDVWSLSRRLRRLTTDKVIVAELQRIEQGAASLSPPFPEQQTDADRDVTD